MAVVSIENGTLAIEVIYIFGLVFNFAIVFLSMYFLFSKVQTIFLGN
jgi:hypothetical protein